MQSSCSPHAILMQAPCNPHAVPMQSSCSPHATPHVTFRRHHLHPHLQDHMQSALPPALTILPCQQARQMHAARKPSSTAPPPPPPTPPSPHNKGQQVRQTHAAGNPTTQNGRQLSTSRAAFQSLRHELQHGHCFFIACTNSSASAKHFQTVSTWSNSLISL